MSKCLFTVRAVNAAFAAALVTLDYESALSVFVLVKWRVFTVFTRRFRFLTPREGSKREFKVV